jgi:hypothetical protein
MKAKSIKGSSAEEIQSALSKSMIDGYKPTIADRVYIHQTGQTSDLRNIE